MTALDLPKTIRLVRVGQDDLENIDAATASAVAAFVSDNHVPYGVPIVVMLDQTKLPYDESYFCTSDWRQVINAIKQLVVRGAPAIGIAGAAAVALRASEFCYASEDTFRQDAADFDRVFVIDEQSFDPQLYKLSMEFTGNMIAEARPTAVNLRHEVDGALSIMNECLADDYKPVDILNALCKYVCQLIASDEATCRAIGKAGAKLIKPSSNILTHCNAGSLATAFYGTALGVVYTAHEQGKVRRVFADETRPVGQGARLTSWELSRAGIPVTLICDNMAAYVMAQGFIDAVIVGADRIARNGDVANKIGTLGVAILAKHFGIPFYVAAPLSSFDPKAISGTSIEIEQRDSREVINKPIAGVDVLNPAFDVTPASLISAIITENGVFAPSDIGNLITTK
ncbi:S-methyl-5-thioribose-1-phosphate isomerase [Adlercreutzia sp. ZJ154]|uniref:S-methyl-5-thioribose-1-phosphate isomerase n=1 Tax=Adlercreutzia sp. ZJ154 TaxID=2709790 RepID=UPI001F14EC0D|nr:S-methyl-5-thioribose-1-phosphate isomerase [Adlercreutzia sp. ZJ154]